LKTVRPSAKIDPDSSVLPFRSREPQTADHANHFMGPDPNIQPGPPNGGRPPPATQDVRLESQIIEAIAAMEPAGEDAP
jgi:hypothetical protein